VRIRNEELGIGNWDVGTTMLHIVKMRNRGMRNEEPRNQNDDTVGATMSHTLTILKWHGDTR